MEYRMTSLEEKFISIVERLTPCLPAGDVVEMLRLAQTHGEYGLALEGLCSLLEHEKIAISGAIRDEIVELFREMEFDADVLSYYEKNLLTQ